jgi:ABC-type nitrate/sulfonate/bicarbonate transport system substrate-binding protein
MMRRRAVIASALLMLACAGSLPAQAGTEITFGTTSNTAFNLAHYVAVEKKYYEAEDIKVDTIIAGAAVGVLQQLAAGSLNMAQAATDQSLRAILRGAPIGLPSTLMLVTSRTLSLSLLLSCTVPSVRLRSCSGAFLRRPRSPK